MSRRNLRLFCLDEESVIRFELKVEKVAGRLRAMCQEAWVIEEKIRAEYESWKRFARELGLRQGSLFLNLREDRLLPRLAWYRMGPPGQKPRYVGTRITADDVYEAKMLRHKAELLQIARRVRALMRERGNLIARLEHADKVTRRPGAREPDAPDISDASGPPSSPTASLRNFQTT